MNVFSTRLRRSKIKGHQRSLKHFPLVIVGILLFTLLQTFSPISQTLAATHPHRLNQQALSQILKRKIHVTHTGINTNATPSKAPHPAPTFNNVGINNSQSRIAGNFDGHGDSYSAPALQKLGLIPGRTITLGGITYAWPAVLKGKADNYHTTGQVISMPPISAKTSVSGKATIGFLGAASNGNSIGTATLTFTDGTSQKFTLRFTDWTLQKGTLSHPLFGNTLVKTATLSHTTNIHQKPLRTYLFTTLQVIPFGKTLLSVTLPKTTGPGQMHIFAVGTPSTVNQAATATYSNIGISDDNNSQVADFDGLGNSYSAQDFSDPNGPGWNPGDTLTYQGINYIWPNVPSGQSDNYVAGGQTVSVTPVAGATTIGFVGSSEHAQPGASGSAKLTYTDGTTQTFTLGMTDWLMNFGSAVPLAGNRLFAILPHINIGPGQQATNSYLFEMETSLTAGKTLQSITFPTSVDQGRLHIFMIGTRASSDFMNSVSTSDDNNTQFADFDGNGASYSMQALQASGLYPGQPFIFNGVSFPWPASFSVAPDNFQVAGQTIPVTPVANANTLAFVGSSTNTGGGISSGTVKITYTDGSTQTFTLSMTDWWNSAPLDGNLLANTTSYINTPTGTQTGTYTLFYADTALQPSKTIQSVTLPTTVTRGQMHIFSIGTRGGLAYNNAGSSDDTRPYTGDFDGSDASYSAQALQNAGFAAGQNVIVNGVTFLWPNVAPGLFNNYQAAGQTIPVTPVANADTLAFLRSASLGPSSGTATITYTDGSTSTFTLGFADWNTSTPASLPFGDRIATILPYRNFTSGRQDYNTYVFETEVPLDSSKTIQNVALPPTIGHGQLHVFSVSTRGGPYNNAGSSDDSQTSAGNFDGVGGSYSNQALQNSGFVAGQNVTVNGVSFLWPNVAPGLFNNYQAAGQTIPVTPIANATTLAFLGSSTNASSGVNSGTATITYTDGTTQTFTLSMTDWWNATALSGNLIAATNTYINTAAGTKTGTFYLYYTDVTLQAGETIQSITLPTTVTSGQMHIFSVGLK